VSVRRLLLALAVVVLLLLALDRGGKAVAERLVADRVQQDQGLASRPGVTIAGFPFLTQVVRGRYDRVDVTVRRLDAGPVPVSLTAHLHDVLVPLGAVLHGRVDRIPVRRATADVQVRYAALDRAAGGQVRFAPGTAGRVHVTASVAGVHVASDVPVTVAGGTLVVHVVAGFDVRVPLGTLPFHARLVTARATPHGVVLTGSASGLVLPAG
jgi:hypothetical protein